MKNTVIFMGLLLGISAAVPEVNAETNKPAKKSKKDTTATIVETFELIDVDADGTIIADEFFVYVKEVSFQQLDANGDGSISLTEWQVEEAGPVGQELFERMDKNTDQKLTVAEFKNTPRMKEVLHNLFKTLDRNGDHKLHKKELIDEDNE
jgi:Ca2+-binding EF-hand superfamily protein